MSVATSSCVNGLIDKECCHVSVYITLPCTAAACGVSQHESSIAGQLKVFLHDTLHNILCILYTILLTYYYVLEEVTEMLAYLLGIILSTLPDIFL